jgi:NAD+ kinase
MATTKKLKMGVVVNRSKAGAKTILNQLLEFSQSHPALELLFEKRTAALISRRGLSEGELAKRSDILLVAGGDGSLLDVVDSVFPHQVPILGVNIGSLGFLTAVSESEMETMLPLLLEKNLRVSPRLVLETIYHRADGKTKTIPCALNDVVVSRTNMSQLVRIRVEVGNFLATEYVCDGLIIATPTGSTAYSLASGGPIVSPDADAVVLTPICPHTLTNRPLVVGTSEPIRLRIVKHAGTAAPTVLFDGRSGGNLHAEEWLEIRPAKSRVQLAYLPQSDFYRVLRQKLKWSGASV